MSRVGPSFDPPPDPFQERHRCAWVEHRPLLGVRFRFESDSPELMRLVQLAYARLPAHRLSRNAPRCTLRLVLGEPPPRPRGAAREPPRFVPLSAGTILCGAMQDANFVALDVQRRTGLIAVSRDRLPFSYHLRYEMLEFAAYVLASRVQKLVPLHAACVGHGGQCALILGDSGAGKSTVSLHCLLKGMEFVAEDSVLVRPRGLLATGVGNYLHIRRDSLGFLEPRLRAAVTRDAAVIRRRSGVQKFEIDLRQPPFHLAQAPLRIRALVFASPRPARGGRLLLPLSAARASTQLAASQRYAAQQPGWQSFARQTSHLAAFELRRGSHPLQAVDALQDLLSGAQGAGRDRT